MSNPYNYNSPLPLKLAATDLSPRQRDLLLHNDSFCIYPWIHIHAYPTGAAYPCCHAEMPCSIGSTRTNTLQHIWNDAPMRELRSRMLQGEKSSACTRCYEQEASGFFSLTGIFALVIFVTYAVVVAGIYSARNGIKIKLD